MEEKILITLTKSQCTNLAEFIDYNLLRAIREDEDIDNIDWVYDMCKAYKKLTEAEKALEEMGE